jgi:cysteine desulfurase
MECYLDNAATTKPLTEVCDLTSKLLLEDYGNPSSLHQKGVEGERYIRQAAEQIAKTLKCKAKNVIFTSGGTESNNTALIGSALANRRKGKHIITTCFEHPSVHEPLIYLENFGYEITYLPVDERGHISADTLKDALRPDTVLVSIMLVNNEIGAVQDVAALSKVIKAYDESILFHVDAIQAYGKMKIYPQKLGIDLLSGSGHKIHGPKGTGFLYQADKVKMHPYIHGGGQQGGRRSGTENVAGIAGLGLAAETQDRSLEERRSHMYELKRHFIEEISGMEGAVVNACDLSALEETAPHIVSVSFSGIKSEVLLHALEEKGIYVSSGSACSSNHPGISGTLKAIGVADNLLDSTLRFSFSGFTEMEEIDYTIEWIKELVPMLARYRRA